MYHTQNQGKLLIPTDSFSNAKLCKIDQSFSMFAAKEWNNLPYELRDCSAVRKFKVKLKNSFVRCLLAMSIMIISSDACCMKCIPQKYHSFSL